MSFEAWWCSLHLESDMLKELAYKAYRAGYREGWKDGERNGSSNVPSNEHLPRSEG